MYCSKCGAQNADGSQFCNKCGAALKPENTSNDAIKIQIDEAVRTEKAGHGITFGGGIVLIISVIGLYTAPSIKGVAILFIVVGILFILLGVYIAMHSAVKRAKLIKKVK